MATRSGGIPHVVQFFAALGRVRCMDETEGFVKILAHAESDRMLGVHIVGPRVNQI